VAEAAERWPAEAEEPGTDEDVEPWR
jgi:hypothetical protein